jgi:membrane protein DedA with SNARE-associated domain
MTDQVIYGLSYVEHLSYIGLFLAVGFSGYAIPIPEEIILILGGFIAAQGISDLYAVMVASVLGAIFGDTLIYYLSGHGSRFTHKYHSRVEQSHVGWYIRHMRKNPMLTIFFSRFIVGMRFFNPLISGLMKISWKKFVVATGLSALIYIPLIILVGYVFHTQIYYVMHIAHSVRRVILLLIGTGSALLMFLFFRNLVEKWR